MEYSGARPAFRLPRPTSTQRLRHAFGAYPTGVCVVTHHGPLGRHGMTVNSFTSVSIDPPLVLISIQQTARAHDALCTHPFAVNVLGAEHEELARHFAGQPGAEPQWVTGTLAPRLAGALAYFECRPWATYAGGDHTLIVGEVHDFDYRGGDALGFNGARFTVIHETDLGHEFLI